MVRGDFGLKAQGLSTCTGSLVTYCLCSRCTCCCLTSENGSGPLAISLYRLYVDGSCSAGRIEIFFLELSSMNGERAVLFVECGLLFPRSWMPGHSLPPYLAVLCSHSAAERHCEALSLCVHIHGPCGAGSPVR